MVDFLLLKWINAGSPLSRLVEAGRVFESKVWVIYLCFFSLYLLYPRRALRRKLYHLVLAIIVATLAAGTVEVLKFSLAERRSPAVVLPEQELRLRLVDSSRSSFPCGPALVTSAVAAVMWRAPGKAQRWAFIAVAVWAAVLPVVVGFSWPSDVAESALLGWVLAKGVFWLAQPENWSPQDA